MDELNTIAQFMAEMDSTNSRNAKKDILRKWLQNPTISIFLTTALNPYKRYGITANRIKDSTEISSEIGGAYTSVSALICDMSSGVVRGNGAVGYCRKFIDTHKEHENILLRIFDKDLKIGADTVIHDVRPGLIPKFDVALAHSFDGSDKMTQFVNTGKYVITRKLDGVRCIARIENGDVTFWSRTGNEYTQLDKLKPELLRSFGNNIVLDGELCIIDSNGKEDFKAAVSQIRRKDYTIQNPHYKIFDVMSISDFDSGASKSIYTDRLLPHLTNTKESNYYSFVSVIQYNEQNFMKAQSVVASKGWEGLILRADTTYRSGRSTDLLKVKKFHDAEYAIEDILPTDKLMLNTLTGRKDSVRCAGSVVIRHKGNPVGVGSGFSDGLRIDMLQNPSKYIGRVITVKYFEESMDDKGNPSLRFPIFKGFRDAE